MATSNKIRALNRLPFDFQDGLKISGVDVTELKELGTSAGASKVGYMPAGTAAVATTVQAKLREFVSVKDFGADPSKSATINTAAIQKAIDAAAVVYIPAGNYQISGTLIIPSNRTLYGDGARVSVLTQTANNSALKASYAGTVSRNQKINLRGFSVYGYSAMTSTLVDLRNTSYLMVDDLTCDGDPTGASKSSGIIIDNTRGGAVFNGYVELRNVYALRGTIGYAGEVNQLNIFGGFYNANGQRGLLITNSVDVQIIGPEVSGNGKGEVAAYSGIYPTGKYDKGGILLDSVTGAMISGVWFEQNANRVAGQYSRNDIEVTSTCSAIDQKSCRYDQSAIVKFHGLGTDAGQFYGNGLGVQNHGSNGLISNGQFQMLDSIGKPLGWVTTGTVDSYSAPSLLPSGVGGIRLTASSSVPKFAQQILTYAQCQKLIGKKVTSTFWAAAVNPTWSGGHARAGFTLGGVSASQSSGEWVSLEASAGAAYKITVTHTVTGTEANGLAFMTQFYQSTGPWSVEIGDVSVSIGEISWSNFDKSVTSAGGDILTPTDFKIGGARHSYGTAAPTSGTWSKGDIVYNTSPTAGGVVGWVCVATGTPGTWVPFGGMQAANAYAVTNGSTARSLNVTADTVAQVAAVLGTLITDLQTSGVLK